MTEIDRLSLEELAAVMQDFIMGEIASRMDPVMVQLAEQSAKIAELTSVIDAWTRLPHVVGMFPDPSEIEQMQVQIFQTHDITTDKRKAGHTEWSLGVEYWSGGKRFPKVNIALMEPVKFTRAVKHLTDASPKMQGYARSALHDAVAGIVRKKIPGGGRGYVLDQFALMFERSTSRPTVVLCIGDTNFVFEKFQPAKGTKDGRAKWFSADFRIDNE